MILTVGHSKHTAEELAALLVDVDVLIDIRSHPTSKWPQFRQAALQNWVPKLTRATYEWEPRLGGWTAEHVAP